MAYVNIKNLVWAEMTDVDEMVYAAPLAVASLMSIKVDTKSSNDTLYGDGIPEENVLSIGETTFEAGVTNFPSLIASKMLGHTLDPLTGITSDHVDDLAPYGAIGFELEKADGTSDAFWYLKGRFEEVGVDGKQKEGKTSFSTPTLKATFLPRADGHRRFKLDPSAGTTPTTVAAFLAAVPAPVPEG